MANPEFVEKEENVVRSAVRAGVHPTTLDRALRSRELRFRWQDGRRLIRVKDLDEWAAKRARRLTETASVVAPCPGIA